MVAQSLIETEALYQMAINHLNDGVYLADREKRILLWNDAAERITGYSQGEIVGLPNGMHLLDYIRCSGAPLSGHDCPVTATLSDGQQRMDEVFLRHKFGYRVPVLLNTVPIVQNKEIIAVMVVFTDNSINLQNRDEVSSMPAMAMIDPFTGLASRRYVEALLQNHLDILAGYSMNFGILFIDLDNFSDCNEKYSYEAGNHILIAIANALRDEVRISDVLGRWEGEEFLGIFEVPSLPYLKIVAKKIRSLVAGNVVEHLGKEIRVTASIGATMASTTDTVKSLTERAISLMHVSKISGRNCYTAG